MNEVNVEHRSLDDLAETLFSHTSDLVVVKDTEHRIVRANERYASIFDATPTELVGRGTRTLWGADAVESVLEDERRVFDGQELRDRERRFPCSGGEDCWYAFNYVPRYDETDSVQGFLAIGREIATRKRIERELELFENAVEAAGHGVYITDPDGTIEYVNPAFETITGYSREEAIGRTPRILNAGEMSEAYFEELWATVLDGELWEEEIVNRTNGGELYRAHQTIAPVEDGAGDLLAFVAIQTDITEYKDYEKRLRRYRQAVENSKALIAAVDRNGTFHFANDRFRAFYGLDDADLSAETLESVIGETAFTAIEPYLDRVFGGERVEFETTREDATGTPRRLAISGYPLRNDEGTVVSAAVSMQDITESYEQSKENEILAEYRRVMSTVNRELVRTDSVEEMLTRVTDIIGSSDLFGCTFAALMDDTTPSFVCNSGSDLDDRAVASFHTTAYRERVIDEGFYWMDDVTQEPFAQHGEDVPAHPGVAIPLQYEDEAYGVLTVHFQRDLETDAVSWELLSEVADDIGFFLYNQSLEHDYRTFQEIAERIDDPIMLQDLDGQYRVINDAVSEYAGRPKSELIDGDEFAFMDDAAAEQIRENKERVLRTESPVEYETTTEFPTKGERSFSTIRYPHYDDSGTLDGTVAICRDVTELKKREQQLRVMDRVLRHNVNNNMNVVTGYAEMIMESSSGETVTRAENIVKMSEKLLETTAKQRQITRFLSNPGSTTRYDIATVVSDIVSTISDRYPAAEIETSLRADVSVTLHDGIPRAIEELLENAITHSDRDQPTVEVQTAVSADTIRIRIGDHGPGIPRMEREVLSGETEVGPLYHGSGLGLWFVNLAVKHADGVLEFEDNEPRGSVVSIRLPR
ncbi:Signal transduction histidine kinase with PAS domain [Halanaeroarchaeum sp. HSR-CO]|uniref:PAS domain-containing protein n=1 Tax=Halanaeroarchaeum sp. HSR-CO TaxID=2866382 RepID=UPI00217E8C7B|nr:PAS domain-containing protein [Halanaeroarchaeum sp. HSR-CO]UWG48459.1 Signal transduction histidine kinase with PAS domain [Halanaeroarchaeum sp. HSR-CO]